MSKKAITSEEYLTFAGFVRKLVVSDNYRIDLFVFLLNLYQSDEFEDVKTMVYMLEDFDEIGLQELSLRKKMELFVFVRHLIDKRGCEILFDLCRYYESQGVPFIKIINILGDIDEIALVSFYK